MIPPGIADALQRDVTEESLPSCLQFVYPHGASLNVIKPSVPVLSTGSASVPLNRPLVSFYREGTRGGKLVVVGAGAMFSDTYLDQEENERVRQVSLVIAIQLDCVSNKLQLYV